MKRTVLFKTLIILLIALFLLPNMAVFAIEKKKYSNWQEVALDMALEFDKAIENIENEKLKDAYENINDAYFGYYEVQGFEKNVMVSISKDRVNHIEALFSDIKHSLLGNQETSHETVLAQVEELKLKVYRDAMVLDGVAKKSSEDTVALMVFENSTPKYYKVDQVAVKETNNAVDENKTQAKPIVASQEDRNWATFVTTFGLLLREGLEAILVIVAIIAYLIKTGNDHLKSKVYWGVLAGIVGSILLAIAIELILGGSGVAQELIEGWTMFLAVIVLFYVSHWMLHKSDTQAWEKYINEKVVQSIDRRSANTLVFAAFLAVLREGAELILFYKASFSGGMNDPKYIVYGLLAGSAVLAVIFISYRFLTVRIPLRPFFLATSILLFLMCVSFMGKGVIELGEAGVISGHTTIPALEGLSVDLLNITNRAETLIPQIMIAFASLWLVIRNIFENRRNKKQQSN